MNAEHISTLEITIFGVIIVSADGIFLLFNPLFEFDFVILMVWDYGEGLTLGKMLNCWMLCCL
jgi:hypothetical protein